MEEVMFGLTGGEREADLARPKAYGIDAQQKWPTLMMIDLSPIKTEERRGVTIGERYSPKRRGGNRRDHMDAGRDLLRPRA
jgi:hypothetical protein